MDFQLSEQFVKDNGLTPEQVSALTNHVSTAYVPELKKAYDGKANSDAEGILTGAAKYAAEKAGVKVDREQGEKWGDYLSRITDVSLASTKQQLANKQKEIEDKLKDFKGGDEYKAQLEALKQEKDTLLKTVAELEPLKGLDQKYKESEQQLSGLKLSVAFNSNRPNFPETVNKYEADAKWNEFKSSVLEKFDIELNESNEAIAVSKENKYTVHKLSDLVAGDDKLKELLQGRQQRGTGADPVDSITVEGLPFKIKKDASSEELSAQVRDHLLKTVKDPTSQAFTDEFTRLYALARKPA